MKIRQLEWIEPTCGPDEHRSVAKADPCEFRYEIDRYGNERKPYRITRSCNINPFKWAETLDAAKAFAQEDFEERIMSAIEQEPTT